MGKTHWPGSFMVVPFKDTEPVSFVAPLKAYIASAFAEDPDQYADDLRTLDAHRKSIMSPEPHEESASYHLKYYAHLHYLSAKFSLDDDHIRIAFTWANALGKEKEYNSSYNVGFEKASVLFNLAAIYCHMASNEPLNSDEAYKRSASYFQQSAGAFTAIIDNLSAWNISGSSSIQLSALSQLMLAYAQQVFIEKAIAGKMKDATLAKLAAQASVFYNTAFETASQTTIFDKSWLNFMQVKANHWKALANYHKSLEVNAAGKYGEQIAWLNAALANIKKSTDPALLKHVSHPKVGDEVKATLSTIEKALQQANKDNDVIYMEIVPKFEALSAIAPARMVSPTALPDMSTLTNFIGKPLFQHLVPFAVHQAASEYSSKKDSVAKDAVAKLTEATAIAFTTLASLNLPAAIDALEQPIGLPAALIRRSEEVRSLGGSKALYVSWDTIQALAKKNWDALRDASERLDQETAEDESVRMQFGSRWTRNSSPSVTKNLRDSEQQLRKKLQDADNANRIVRTKLDANLHLIESLSVSREELEASIPASTTASTLALKDPNVKELKGLMDKLNANIKRRTDLVDRIKKAALDDDIAPRLLDAVVLNENFDKKDVFAKQLQLYEPFHAEIKQMVAEQEQILQLIVACNKRFVESRQTNDLIRQRENALQSLENGYKSFKDIMANMDEGIKFYSDLEVVMQKFVTNCKDFVMARDIEKKDILAQIQRNISNIRITDPLPSTPTPNPSTGTTTGAPPQFHQPQQQPLVPQQGGFYTQPQAQPSAPGIWQPGQQPLQYGGGGGGGGMGQSNLPPPIPVQPTYYVHAPGAPMPAYNNQMLPPQQPQYGYAPPPGAYAPGYGVAPQGVFPGQPPQGYQQPPQGYQQQQQQQYPQQR